MHSERIDVIAYSGRRGDERPVAFVLRGLRIDIMTIADEWIEEDIADHERMRFFRVEGSDGNTHCIYFSEDAGEWYYAF